MIIGGKDLSNSEEEGNGNNFQVLEKSYKKTSVCLINKDPFKREQVDTWEITI